MVDSWGPLSKGKRSIYITKIKKQINKYIPTLFAFKKNFKKLGRGQKIFFWKKNVIFFVLFKFKIEKNDPSGNFRKMGVGLNETLWSILSEYYTHFGDQLCPIIENGPLKGVNMTNFQHFFGSEIAAFLKKMGFADQLYRSFVFLSNTNVPGKLSASNKELFWIQKLHRCTLYLIKE